MEVGLAVGGALLSSALNVFFDRMTPKFPHLFHGRKADDQLLRKLKRTLFVIEVVLDDAEDKQNTNNYVKKWLRELKDTVYHAEDLIDEINTESLRLEIEGGEHSVAKSVSHFSDEFLDDIIPKIEDIVSTLEYFSAQINVLGLGRGVTKKDSSYRLPSTSVVNESVVYGRDNDREKLLNMVLSDDANGNNVNVIPIVGMGGLGKTTLAQLVYSDKRVKEHFQKQAWVCVSENYDAFKITKTLVDGVVQLGSEEKDDFNRLQVKLKESLAEQKFLIVLDDVWNEKYTDWDKLTLPLKYGEKGSKIILTTRIEKIALMVRSELPIHHLNPLSIEDCWLLFKKHAFDNGGPVASPEFEKVGKEIVKKCKGLPLAVMALGGLLRSKTEVKEWNDISTSQFWTLENDVLPILRLSYQHLPPHLKHCFAFCALFPKNYRLKEEELVLLWMANDLLQHPSRNGKTIEDMGHEYINELRSRSLFQKESDGIYVMHDLVNDLAHYVSGNFCVREDHYYQHEEIPSEARHFSYMSELFLAETFNFLVQMKSLRTFINMYPISDAHKISKIFISNILPELMALRVLSLKKFLIEEVPDSVCKLKHLRYINLSWTLIKQLPDAICSMHNLQTLNLSWCHNLHELPMNFSKLINLRHLELIGTKLREMPSHMGRLKSLQTLSYFIVGRSPGKGIEELEKLNLRGSLKIEGLQNVMSCNDAVKANLKSKNHLEVLILEWIGSTGDSQIDKDIFEKLRPHTSLKSLTINGYDGTSFPDWLADESYCNIVSLSLLNCRNCFSLPALGHLLSLKSIYIERLDSISKVGEELYGDASLTKPFQSLVSLTIKHLFEWEEWDSSGNVDFSRLEELHIKDCPKLIGKLPSQLSRLRKLEISRCPRVVILDDWLSISENKQVDLRFRFHLSSLRVLTFSDMPNLKEFPDSLLRLRNINELKVTRCGNLVSFPMIQDLDELPERLCRIKISKCDNLLSFPSGGLPAPNLEYFTIKNCKKLKSLPEKMHSLKKLEIRNCPEIESLPEGGLPLSLKGLSIENCEKLTRCKRSWDLQKLVALRKFSIGDDNEDFCWLLPCSLKVLSIGCEKLKTLDHKTFHGLTSLETLGFFYLTGQLSLPVLGLPDTLSTLILWDCPLLKPHLERDKGKYWSTVAHISNIQIFD